MLTRTHHTRTFRIPGIVIWSSSIYIGILSSVPKILRLGLELPELGIDISIASTFSLFVWYFNLYNLPRFISGPAIEKFSGRRLIMSLLAGAVIMFALVLIHQWLLPQYHFRSMMLMYEFRGLIINLTIFLFLNILHQQHTTRLINLELEKARSEKVAAQFELLKQQVNPHFLFNSLNTLKSMVELGDKNAAHYIVMLSDFYRSSLEQQSPTLVPVEKELETLQAFVFLLKARFEDAIRVNIDIRPEHRLSYIPPFTLQLLLENSIKHNIVSLEKPLHIDICSAGEAIVVRNNLQLKQAGERSTGTGLHNIDQRYFHIFKKHIQIDKTDHSFSVKLPVAYENSYS